ncbi:MAG: phosphate/phosphite/phosphonate ABC transporter substrate-binding protein [Thermodesulfobacteriota bacterium]
MKYFYPEKSSAPATGLFWLPVVFCLVVLLSSGCDRQEKTPQVSLTERVEKIEPPRGNIDPDAVKIAIAAMISPKETYNSYKELVNLVSEKLGRPIQIVQRKTYQEVNDLLEQNLIDAAFVCTGAYVKGHDKFGMELLVAPVVNGAPLYYSYIIVHRTSVITDLEGLRNKEFSFTDPMSNTGKAAPTSMLAAMGESPESFFSETLFTYSHDNSIKAVAHKIVAGAAVDSLVWDYLHEKNNSDTLQTRIIQRSEPYGIPPFVAAPGTDPVLKEKLQQILLEMHNSENGKQILQKIMIERFVEVNDDIYDSVRKMSMGSANK